MRKGFRIHLYTSLLIAALAVCAPARIARADDPLVPPTTVEVASGSLSDAINANPSATVFNVTGANISGCSIPDRLTVNVSGGMGMDGCTNAGTLNVTGTVTGDFYNTGTVTGAGHCSGTIYKLSGSVGGGGVVRIPGPGLSGVSEVRYSDGSSESAKYVGSTLWILEGKSVRYVVINDYVCTSDGARLAYTITYKYNNQSQSAMTLDSKKYPTVYYVKAVPQDLVPEAPDTEVDYAFQGWYCKALGYDENNLQKTVSIDADKGGNLTLISWWTLSPGHNEGKSNATTGMAAGGGIAGGMAGGGGSGAAGALSGLMTTDEDDEEETDTVLDFSSGNSTGMRVRTASSVQRHTFTGTQSNADIEAMAASRRQSDRFPWQWLGIGLGGALLLTAAGLTVRRKLDERNTATLEKLNIHN